MKWLVAFLVLTPNALWAARSQDISRGWQFERIGWLESQTVNLPHTWNAADGADGGTYLRAAHHYRKTLPIRFNPLSQSVYLRLGAASLTSNVIVNGIQIGQHQGGCAAICYDVTRAVHPGNNSIEVIVDNSWNESILPLSGDFTVYGGLYRGAEILILNKVCISPIDDAGPGVYLSPKVVSGNGDLSALIKLRNTGPTTDAKTTFELKDAAGKSIAKISTTSPLQSGDHDLNLRLMIPDPRLWDGIRDPYVYKTVTTLEVHGKVVDRIVQPCGFRTFSIDPQRGFILNGRAYDYHGVNLHQGRPDVGWAATQSMREEDYRFVKEIGASGVRLAHYQHADEEYTLCDQYGFVTWAEIPLVDKSTDSKEFVDNAYQQFRELIKQNYNHPSICFWSVYNEPRIERDVNDRKWRYVINLVTQAHQIDPIRIVTGAASERPDWWLDWVPDQTAFNRYWGWYGGKAQDWGAELDKMRGAATKPNFGISEYGAGASIRQHEFPPKQPVTTGNWHPEEYQSYFHEQSYSAMRERPWIWCKLIWNMFDFASDGRSEGDHAGINDKGLITGDRKTKKDAFYYYQSQWSEKPMLHLCSQRYNPRPAQPTTLRIYSNDGPVELIVNGNSLGQKPGDHGIYEWPVTLDPGMNKVLARSRHRSETVRWTGVLGQK